MEDISDDWDIINLSFAEPDAPTTGNLHFDLCNTTDCPGAEGEDAFIKAIAAKRASGKIVQISIGGQNGQVTLTSDAARDQFVSTVGGIIDKFGLDGLDIDFEGSSISLDTGDNDFKNPTTPAIVNLISALKSLKAKYGDAFTLTFAPETFFVQLGLQFYGSGKFGGQDPRAGSYLPIIDALRDDITMVHVQDYNSGPIVGLDGTSYNMGNADFHVAMTDILLAGFPVAGNTTNMFAPLKPIQVGFGAPSSVDAGNGYIDPSQIQNAVSCITSGTNCGSYTPKAKYPDFRGVMAWSINWDQFFNATFHTSLRPFLDSLP